MRILNGTELRLYGPVGYYDGAEGFASGDVVDALAEVGPSTGITVRINSGGGFAHEGVAIHTALAAHRGRVTVSVDGVAASAASLIAMAGAEIVMATGALMMIHDPSLITIGTVAEHDRGIAQLEATAAAMAAVYARRTGKSLSAVRADMAREVWLTGPEAVAQRYASREVTAPAKAAASFDYGVYSRVPWTQLAAMQAQARADSPEGRAGAAGWRRAAARISGGSDAPAASDTATERAQAIRSAAAERGVVALGDELAAGKLPVKDALAILYRLPRCHAQPSAIAGSPTLAEQLLQRP